MAKTQTRTKKKNASKRFTKEEVLNDYRLAVKSRECSLLGRKEALTGKAKFGIFGDGKELPQLVLSKFFEDGDFRSGYYRDQTIMFAIDQLTVPQFFAQLYAHADQEADPHSGGRQMNAHFATRSLDENGEWRDLTKMKNTSPDMSPTAGQMARLLGLAQASKIYRESSVLPEKNNFSKKGREVAFGTIGDASTSEGIFWETINAAGVLQVPMVMSVWDDGYGISVPRKFQTTKGSISEVLKGFQRTKNKPGLEIITVKAWDYPALHDAYEKAVKLAREAHIPSLIHVTEVTQPQGHSTSGSHERYKSDERLEWEKTHCCNTRFRDWIIDNGYAKAEELDEIEEKTKKKVRTEKREAWTNYVQPIKEEAREAHDRVAAINDERLADHARSLESLSKDQHPHRRNIFAIVREALWTTAGTDSAERSALKEWYETEMEKNRERYDAHNLSESELSPLTVEGVEPTYDEDAKEVDGRVVLRDNFDVLFERHPEILAFGEDVGKLGDVNLGMENLQEKYGELRVSDTGIREATILGQGIGMSLRGLRPITDIQYLDYIFYCFQVMSDDLASIRYRSMGGQKAPAIIRTRGHRLEGIWHSGSPMGVLVNGSHGIHICVPRNLTEAAGMYNTVIEGDDPALIVEPLNAYRSKEKMPNNLGDFKIPLGVPQVVREGSDLTIVSYGSTFNICESAVDKLAQFNISAELIDVRTLLPFDRHHNIVESLKKTNRILFVDEDMPGAVTAYMMQKVIDEQEGYRYLDSQPKALSAKPHRPAYGTDGDYFSKPNLEDIFEAAYELVHEADPKKYPEI